MARASLNAPCVSPFPFRRCDGGRAMVVMARATLRNAPVMVSVKLLMTLRGLGLAGAGSLPSRLAIGPGRVLFAGHARPVLAMVPFSRSDRRGVPCRFVP